MLGCTKWYLEWSMAHLVRASPPGLCCTKLPGSNLTLTIDFNFSYVHFISNYIILLPYSIYYFSSACGYKQIKYQFSIFIFSFVKWAFLLDNRVILILAIPHNIRLENLEERIYRSVTASVQWRVSVSWWEMISVPGRDIPQRGIQPEQQCW